ncbi:MAG TPA: hypothetical protein VGH52_00800 [Gaiellaceae bacterium]|jgi:hypothetical protein
MVRVGRVLLAAAIVACVLAPISTSGVPESGKPRVIFITKIGAGVITSLPHGISCGKACRSRAFHDDQTVRLTAKAAPGWKFQRWSGSWCTGKKTTCVMTLTDTHDCANGNCPIGAFGVRVTFVRSEGST